MQFLPLSVCLLLSITFMPQASTRRPAEESKPNESFTKLSEQFIHETLVLSPSTASFAGYHRYVDPKTGNAVELDAVLDDMGPAAMAEKRKVYAQWSERFQKETPVQSLGLEDTCDWQLIDDSIALNLLEFDHIQSYKHNPMVYVELLGSAGCVQRSG